MKKLIKLIVLIIISVLLVIGIYVFANGYILYKQVTEEMSIIDKVTQIQQSDYFISIDEMPENYKNAVIAVEDHRFEQHGTIDVIAIGRALVSNFRNKDLVEGGSTITQQVAKNLYFMEEDTKNDSLDRKIAEILIGMQLEKKYSKDEIFELYVNNIYFGDGYYCLKDATQGYFNKQPLEMNLYECTLLAGIPNAPSVYSPNVNPELSKSRHRKVIKMMVKYGYLTEDEASKINLNDYYE